MKSKKRLSVLVILAVMVAMLALPMSAYAAVKINKTKATINVGKTVTLKITGAKKGTKIKWASNKKAVATVSSKGLVKGVKAGKAKITATVGKKKYSCTVTVKKAANGSDDKITAEDIKVLLKYGDVRIALDPVKETDLDLGEEVKLTARTNSKSPLTWVSSDPEVVSVDANGLVKGLKEGHATVTAISTEDATISKGMDFTVLPGYKLKTETYGKYLNFELKAVPVLRMYVGEYRYDDTGNLVCAQWGNPIMKDGIHQYITTPDGQKHYLYEKKSTAPVLSNVSVDYYIALDAASLQKNYDFNRSDFSVKFAALTTPWTTMTLDTTNPAPSFAVKGLENYVKTALSENFAFSKYGAIANMNVDYWGDPIFEDPREFMQVYKMVYPEDVIANPIFGYKFDSIGGSSKPVKDSATTREYLFRDLVDTGTFSVINVAGTIAIKR
jgi:hypothetical protein